MKNYIIAPSLLSANFLNLENELKICINNNVEWIHYDVIDNHFAPNLTFGWKVLQDIKQKFDLKIDIHFMVKLKNKDFKDFFIEYINANPEMMTMHIESMNKKQLKTFIQICRENNIKSSIALSPNTPIKKIIKYLPKFNNVLVMTVEPGYSGQNFIKHVAGKIAILRKIIDSSNLKTSIEVDGGINEQTIKVVKNYGVDMIVAGSYLFGHKDFEKRIKVLKND